MIESAKTTAAPPVAPRAFALVLFAILVGSFNQYVGTALPVFREALQHYFHLNERGYGLLMSTGMAASTLGALVAGVLSVRFGARQLLRAGFIVQLISPVMAGYGASLPVMVTALFVMGMVGCFLFINLQTYLFERFPGNRRQIASLQLVVPATLMMATNVLAEFLFTRVQQQALIFADVLHIPFFLLAGVTLLGCLLLGTAGGGAPPAPAARFSWTGMVDGFRFPPAAWWLIGLMALHGTADAVVFAWAPKILGNTHSFPAQLIRPGYAVAVASLCYMLSRAALTLLPERFGARAMLTLPGLLGGGLLTAGLLTHHQGLAAAGFIAGAGLWSLEYPAFLATLSGVERHRYAAAVSVSLLIGGPLSLALSFAVGCIGDAFGPARAWTGLLLPAALFLGIGLAGGLWLLLFRRPPNTPAAS